LNSFIGDEPHGLVGVIPSDYLDRDDVGLKCRDGDGTQRQKGGEHKCSSPTQRCSVEGEARPGRAREQTALPDSEHALKIQPLDEAVERAEQTGAHIEAKLEAAGE
jgi:hypothetical protein